MEVLRTTGVTAWYTCPYKAKNDVYQPNPANTYHGDLLNVGATSTNAEFDKLLAFYAKNINPDFKMNESLGKLMGAIKTYMMLVKDNAVKNGEQVFQETKLYHKYNNDIWIEGQPDMFIIKQEPDENGCRIDCYDFKCSTHSRYSGDEMWTLNMQTYIYPAMIMKIWGEEKCSFTYIVGDKNNAKLKRETKIRTLKECEDKIKEVMEDYISNQLTESYPGRENKLCMFCGFGRRGDKSCPLIQAKIPKIIKTSDIEAELFS